MIESRYGDFENWKELALFQEEKLKAQQELIDEMKRINKIMAEWVIETVESELEDALEDCAYLEACEALKRKPKEFED